MNAPQTLVLDRTKYLGGSDVAAILGISPWRTQLDVFFDKIRPRVEETDPARVKVLTRGKRMEPYVIDLLQEETGLLVVRRGQRYVDSELPFIAAEIDAEAQSGENIEIKTSSPFKSKEWGEQQTDEIPIYYTAQAMHGMMVTNAPVCVFGVLIGADDFRVYRVERDNETIAAIREKEIAFWDRVQRNDAPEPTTVSDVLTLYGAKDAGTAIEANDAIEADVFRLRNLKEDLKKLGAQAEEAEERIKVFMADHAILTIKGAPVVTWKAQSASRFDQTAFKAAHPDLYEAFKKTSETRVMRVK
ncbi:YqaJ viral recombinase family protein [Paraburkholderia unamae]|uniref:Phage-type endonuclease n=1 Tax=Paraburkholderia unamae TaxID=219649 RepID=A0ABX5KFP2_9BURK|nr:YqaJ viral recombinase family protein [Paraburkholderia unamae]PVX77206.1 putative phage-type endonuclease [Paraburkholderia unamae]